jgi:hypothetical protein
MSHPSSRQQQGCVFLLFAAVLIWCASGSSQAQDTYRLTILGPIDQLQSFVPRDVNNAGQVLGTVSARDGPRVTLWDGVTVIDLGVGQAWDINNAGAVAGSLADPAGLHHATIWTQSGPTTLHQGPESSLGLGVNDHGQVIGVVDTGLGLFEATVWQNGNAATLGPGFAQAINNLGQAVGEAGVAALWDSNGVTLLGGSFSQARDINDRGQIVGYDNNHAHLWYGSTSVQLDFLGVSSIANAINATGQSVGAFNDGLVGPRAALWNGTVGTDLNSLLRPESVAAGWSLDWADGINDSGWIVGLAHNTNQCEFGYCQRFGFLLSHSALPDQVLNITGAVPEPSTYVLMLAGLAAIGVWAQRSRVTRRRMRTDGIPA